MRGATSRPSCRSQERGQRIIIAAAAIIASAAAMGCGGAAATAGSKSTDAASPGEAANANPAAKESAGAAQSPKTTDTSAGAQALATINQRAEAAAENEPFDLLPSRTRPAREPRRPSVSPIPFNLAGLPVAHIEPPLKEAAATRAAFAAATPTNELVVRVTDRPARADYLQAVVTAPNAAFSEIRVGTWVGWGGGPYARDSGAFITCSQRYSGILPARWQTLTIKEGIAELVITDGWFDQEGCKASVVRRTTVRATPLFDGQLIYAFRACGATCGELEELTLVFPRAQNIVASAIGGEAQRDVGSFTTVSIPIRRGGGGSMMARLPGFEIHAFRKSADLRAEPAPARASKENQGPIDIFFGVEVSQTIQDPEPFAIAYIGPENAMKLAASLGVGHPDVGLSATADPGPGCACQPGDPLCSCF